jgi:hypothetical protein
MPFGRERIQPQVGIAAFQGSVAKAFHKLVQLLTDPGDLAFINPGEPQSFQQIIDLAGAHAFQIGGLYDRQECFFRSPPRLEQAGEVAAFAELGDLQREFSHSCLPCPFPIAVAPGLTAGGPLITSRSNEFFGFQFNGKLGYQLRSFTEKIAFNVDSDLAKVLK